MANASTQRQSGINRGPQYGPAEITARAIAPTGPTTGGPGSGPGSGGGSPAPPGGGSGAASGPTGGPAPGPSGGGGAPGPGPGPTGGTGGTGVPDTGGGTGTGTAAGGTDGGYYVDPGFNAQLASSFFGIIQNAMSPDAMEAQNIILRRIALEGDVTGSRVPPPRNITEIGGYLNFLATTNQPEMRSEVLAGILGVAGANPPLGWIATTKPAVSFISIQNDRPPGAAQSSIPVSIFVRSDFADPLKAAIKSLHDQGATLPLQSGPVTLPLATPGAQIPNDILPYLGRAVYVAPAAALSDPTTDSIAIVRKSGTTNPYELAARALTTGTVAVTPDNYDAVKCTSTASSTVTLTGAKLVLLATPLANAGFYEASPLPMPANLNDMAWTRLTNTTGLIKGTTKLAQELAQLYGWSDIANSVFAQMLDAVWDGTTFTTP